MCQIIRKPKGYVLRDDLLESTCYVNADGFGYMYHNGTELKADKAYAGDNDPSQIKQVIEALKDEEVFFHFRYRTKGEVDTASCHPFKIFDDFDREVWLMHNGTINEYGSTTKVDSEDFGERMAGPLYGTFLKAGVQDPMADPMYNQILSKFIGGGSKVVLLDSKGASTIIHESSGDIYHDQEADQKFWVSNLYSFNQRHRTPTTVYTYSGQDYKWVPKNDGSGGYKKVPKDYVEPQKGQSVVPFTGGGSATSNSSLTTTMGGNKTGQTPNSTDAQRDTPTTVSGTRNTRDMPWDSIPPTSQKIQDVLIAKGVVLRETTSSTFRQKKHEAGKVKPRMENESYWQDVLKLESIEPLLDLTMENIEELVDQEPHNAALLIKDLLWEIYVASEYYDEQIEDEGEDE